MALLAPGLLQQRRDRRVAAPPGVGQRGHAVAIGQVDVGPGGDQQADDLDVARPAIAEEDRLQQGRPAEAIDVVHCHTWYAHWGGMLIRQVMANGKAYIQQGEMRKDMPPEMKLEMEKSQFRDPNFILLNATMPGAKVRGVRPTAEGGVSYDTMEIISPDGDVYKVLLDPKTHQVARMEYAAEQKEVHDTLGDYRVVDGVSFPFKFKHEAGGQEVDIQYDKVTVNPKLSADLFQ